MSPPSLTPLCLRVFVFCRVQERARFKLGIDQMVIQSGKFNAQSSADERKDLLQAVLREGVKYGSEVRAPSDADINQMMARTADEVDLFTRIDAEIDERDRQAWAAEGKGPDGPPSRLVTEAEVPEFIRNPEQVMEQQKGPTLELGRGGKGRQTKGAVSYAEELTDKEFERALERGEDPYEAVLRKQERRILVEQGILPETTRKRKKKRPMNGDKKPRLDREEVKDEERLEDAEGLLEDTDSSGDSSDTSANSGDDADGDDGRKRKVKDEGEDEDEEKKESEDADSSPPSVLDGDDGEKAPVRRRLLGSGKQRRRRPSLLLTKRGRRQSRPSDDDSKDARDGSGKEEKEEAEEDEDDVKEAKEESSSAPSRSRRRMRSAFSSASSVTSSPPPLVPPSRAPPPLPFIPLRSSPPLSASSSSSSPRPPLPPSSSKPRRTALISRPPNKSPPPRSAGYGRLFAKTEPGRRPELKAEARESADFIDVASEEEEDRLSLSQVLHSTPTRREAVEEKQPQPQLEQSPVSGTTTRRKPRRA